MRAPLQRPAATAAAAQRPLLGMANMMGAGLTNQVMNGTIREIAALGLHPFEAAFFRALFGSLFLSGFVIRSNFAALKTHSPWLQVLRAVLNAASMLCFFLALTYLPLAKLSALMFTSPLFAAIGATLVLRERMGPARLIGLAVGLAGALVVMRPGVDDITTGTWLALASSATWGAALVVIKQLSRRDSSLTIAIYAAYLMLPFNLAAALFVWSWPGLLTLALCAVVGAMGTISQIMLGNAFKLADATVVLPCDFTKLVWAALVGYLWFGEVPDSWTWIGGTVIFASTLFIALRERAGAARTRRAASAAKAAE